MSEATLETSPGAAKRVCNLCDAETSGKCGECGDALCSDCGVECEGTSCWDKRFCPDCAPYCACEEVICEECAMSCHSCESSICSNCGHVCPDCDQWYCTSCVTFCGDCSDAVCFEYCYDTHAEENGCEFP